MYLKLLKENLAEYSAMAKDMITVDVNERFLMIFVYSYLDENGMQFLNELIVFDEVTNRLEIMTKLST